MSLKSETIAAKNHSQIKWTLQHSPRDMQQHKMKCGKNATFVQTESHSICDFVLVLMAPVELQSALSKSYRICARMHVRLLRRTKIRMAHAVAYHSHWTMDCFHSWQNAYHLHRIELDRLKQFAIFHTKHPASRLVIHPEFGRIVSCTKNHRIATANEQNIHETERKDPYWARSIEIVHIQIGVQLCDQRVRWIG